MLPAPAIGELEALTARAEAFKARSAAPPAGGAGGARPPAPARLVGGDAGSMRQVRDLPRNQGVNAVALMTVTVLT